MRIKFIQGETVDLCVPHDSDIPEWTQWINDPQTTRFLETGMFPQTEDMQRAFISGLLNAKDRVILTICDKADVLLGTISLAGISFEKRECHISMVIPNKSKGAPYAALEAMALMITHAFERLGVRRVYAGQAYPDLSRWNETIELIGFFPEGLVLDGFIHGTQTSHAIKIGVYKEDYDRIKRHRGGRLLPSVKAIPDLIARIRSKDRSHQKILDAVSAIRAEALKSLLDEPQSDDG